jgi:hypothetical protein
MKQLVVCLRSNVERTLRLRGTDLSMHSANEIAAVAAALNSRRAQISTSCSRTRKCRDGLELAHYIRNRWPPVKLIVVSSKLVIDPQELPPGVRFFPKPYRETSIVEAMVGMFSGGP